MDRTGGADFLLVNGRRRDYGPGAAFPGTLAELVESLGLDAVTVVAEVDGRVAARGEFPAVALRPGMAVELVRFVGGG